MFYLTIILISIYLITFRVGARAVSADKVRLDGGGVDVEELVQGAGAAGEVVGPVLATNCIKLKKRALVNDVYVKGDPNEADRHKGASI